MLQIEEERELLSDQRNLMESFNSLCFESDLETFEVNITVLTQHKPRTFKNLKEV